MEKVLQSIVRKFIKQIDFNKIKLKNVKNGKATDVDPSEREGSEYHIFVISLARAGCMTESEKHIPNLHAKNLKNL